MTSRGLVGVDPVPGQDHRTPGRSDLEDMQASAYVPRRLRCQVERVLLNDPAERHYSRLIEELLQKWLREQKESA